MESPAERLRRARELARYETAADAAKAIGVRYATYAGHENGSRGFKGQAERYATFYQVDLNWLLTGKGQPRSESLQARLLALSPEGQRTVRDMIELLEQREAARRKTG
jgi:DNA-binding XRE family transcriptional regulator